MYEANRHPHTLHGSNTQYLERPLPGRSQPFQNHGYSRRSRQSRQPRQSSRPSRYNTSPSRSLPPESSLRQSPSGVHYTTRSPPSSYNSCRRPSISDTRLRRPSFRITPSRAPSLATVNFSYSPFLIWDDHRSCSPFLIRNDKISFFENCTIDPRSNVTYIPRFFLEDELGIHVPADATYAWQDALSKKLSKALRFEVVTEDWIDNEGRVKRMGFRGRPRRCALTGGTERKDLKLGVREWLGSSERRERMVIELEDGDE